MRIMSFNLRMDTPHDQEHAWPHRIPAARRVLHALAPDIFGIQEGLPHMVAEVASWSDHYASIGRGRLADGTGEAVTIFYRKDRFQPLESGHFWLSETPDVPGSATFGNTIPRMVTWIRLKEEDGREWLCVNTHLDHASEPARRKGARMIADFVSRARDDALVVVMGDFNATPGSVPIETMLQTGLVDAVAAAGDRGATFHGYRGQGGDRIDYIFCDARLNVRGGSVFRERVNGLFPSDHYPVFVDLD